LETGPLSDGRKWLLNTNNVSLADLQGTSHFFHFSLKTLTPHPAVWPLEWLTTLPGALSSEISPITFPKTFSWISRFTALLPSPKTIKIPTIKGPEAKERILAHHSSSTSSTGETGIKDGEVTYGEEVEVTPTDTGKNHPQRGRVREIGSERVVLEVVPTGEYQGGIGKSIRVVFPRRGFSIKSVQAKGKARL
jgi:hypothetical protein